MPALPRLAARHLAEAFVAGWLLILPLAAVAKPLPWVTASFEGAPASVALGTPVALTLRLTAGGATPDVTAEVLPVPGLRVSSGPAPWRGALAAGQVLDLPVVVELTGVGEYTLGARGTARTSAGRQEVSGATLSVVGAGGVARLSRESHAVRRLREAETPADRRRLGVASPAPIGAPPAAVEPHATPAVVTGTVQWQDPEGHRHPVRAALVQIWDDPPLLVAPAR
jgi:hypothetical protein